MTIEILAPAGGREQLMAAVRSGADAVYLGTRTFNARRNAENFTEGSLREAVEYCHGRGVKVYATLNTLVKDTELGRVYNEIEILAGSGIDAVIIQDLAAAELFHRHCPTMPLHASTQMSIHNLEGVMAAEQLGFSRVVPARELSLEEIRKICQGSAIEIEIFVHGALCMSVSGQCFFSSVLGARSGNRGLCAQPCRLDFKSGNLEYALSLKDMSHINHIGALMEAGVSSLKIEGRMKRPEYVAAAVRACREAVAGRTADLTRLQAVFSRSGFTDGYITGKRNRDMFGHRTREDVKAAGEVLGEIAATYRNEFSRAPVEMMLQVRENENSRLKVFDGVNSITVQGEMPERAEAKGIDHEFAYRSLAKMGGTPFTLKTLTTDLDGHLMLARGKINALRKQALEKLLAARSRIIPREFTGPFVQPQARRQKSPTRFRIRLENPRQLFSGGGEADRIYMPIDEITPDLMRRFGNKMIGELPRLVFPRQEKKLAKNLKELGEQGLRHVCAGNIGTIRLAKQMGFTIHGSFDLNILNSMSLMKYETMGLADTILSYEINLGDAAALGGKIPRGIIGYGYLPLMVFRNCPVQDNNGCGNCAGSKEIIDRTGARFKVLCQNREYSTLLNHIPLYLADKKIQGIDFTTLYFTTEDSLECKRIWDSYLTGRPYPGKFTRGLYYRKLV